MNIASVSETLSWCRGSLNLHFTCRATKVDSCGCKKDSKSFRSLRENSFPMTSKNTLEPNLWVQWFVWVLLNERLYLNVHFFMPSMSWTYFHKQRSYPLPAVWQNALYSILKTNSSSPQTLFWMSMLTQKRWLYDTCLYSLVPPSWTRKSFWLQAISPEGNTLWKSSQNQDTLFNNSSLYIIHKW